MATTWQEHGNNMARAWQHHGKGMANGKSMAMLMLFTPALAAAGPARQPVRRLMLFTPSLAAAGPARQPLRRASGGDGAMALASRNFRHSTHHDLPTNTWREGDAASDGTDVGIGP